MCAAVQDAGCTCAAAGELSQACFSMCGAECMWHGPMTDWVIQGRVCTLSLHLLFYSHMDLGLRMKSARLPDPELQTTLIPPSANAVDHWSQEDLNERSYGFKRGPVLIFHPSQTCWLCRCICLGQSGGLRGGKPCGGGQWSPVLNWVGVGGPWQPRGLKLRAQPDG